MENPAPTNHPIHDLIQRRWSPRAFATRPVETEKLASLFEAARWAPSSFNLQPWRYIVATRDNEAAFERLLGCLRPQNILWAQHAPVLILGVAELVDSDSGRANRHAIHDLGLANENLVLQAVALGLVSHQMGGFFPDKARAAYGIPEEYEAITAIAVGYPGEADDLPDELKERELRDRERDPISDFVFANGWGQEWTAKGGIQ
jgi:nitroreductase